MKLRFLLYGFVGLTALFVGVMAYLVYYGDTPVGAGFFDSGSVARRLVGGSRTVSGKGGKLTIGYTGDIVGALDPCGCTEPAMGGIARRATAIKDYRRQHPDRPLLLVETGNAMKQGDDLDDPASRWVVEALQALGSHAVNTTVADLRRLNRLVERGRVPNDLRTAYLATAIEPPSGKHFPTKPYLVQPLRAEKGNEEVRVGILAVSAGNEGSVDVGKVIDVDEALRRHVPEVDAQSDIVVLLTRTSDPELGRLAQTFPAIDVIINGSAKGEGREFERKGGAVMVESAHRGIGLGVLEIEWDASGRIEKSSNQIIPLPPPMPDDPELVALTEKAHRETTDYLEEEAKRSPPVTVPSMFAGANACKDCHQAAFGVWKSSGHAHAIETLKRTRDHFNAACLMCHVTGFADQVGGFVNVLRTPELTDVQCEACHGPSLMHSKNPQDFHPSPAEHMRKRVKKEFCLRCHTPENSANFNFDTYWKKIQH